MPWQFRFIGDTYWWQPQKIGSVFLIHFLGIRSSLVCLFPCFLFCLQMSKTPEIQILVASFLPCCYWNLTALEALFIYVWYHVDLSDICHELSKVLSKLRMFLKINFHALVSSQVITTNLEWSLPFLLPKIPHNPHPDKRGRFSIVLGQSGPNDLQIPSISIKT